MTWTAFSQEWPKAKDGFYPPLLVTDEEDPTIGDLSMWLVDSVSELNGKPAAYITNTNLKSGMTFWRYAIPERII